MSKKRPQDSSNPEPQVIELEAEEIKAEEAPGVATSSQPDAAEVEVESFGSAGDHVAPPPPHIPAKRKSGMMRWIIAALKRPSIEHEAKRVAAIASVANSINTPVGASETSRLCPFCAESIKPLAAVCRFCGRDVPPVVVFEPTDDPAAQLEAVRQQYPAEFDR